MKILQASFVIDEYPENCRVCCFNQTDHCSLKEAFQLDIYGNNYVQNNTKSIDERCPLIFNEIH